MTALFQIRNTEKLMGILLIVGLFACQQSKQPDEGASWGNIKVGVDETLLGMAQSEVDAFQFIYPKANINLVSVPEQSLFQKILDDSVRMIIATRPFSNQESDYLKGLTLNPRTYLIGQDALAFVIHKSNKDSLLTYNQSYHLLTGKISSWKQIAPNSPLSDVVVVFDHPQSGTLRYIREITNMTESVPKNFYSAGSSKGVVDYVATHTNAIGVIGLGEISDLTDKENQALYSKINFVAIQPKGGNDALFYPPLQGNLFDSIYPYRRPIYMLSRETRTGLATGFAAYVQSDKGQRIIQKSGLAAKELASREIILNVPNSDNK